MSGWSLPITGGCRCGGVRLSLSAPPMITMACHCLGCQRMTAGPYSLSMLVPADAFVVTTGEVVVGGLRAQPRHFFCPYCLTWMFSKSERSPERVILRSTMLDDTRGVAPFIESWTLEKLPFAATGATHSFERFPDRGIMPDLMRAYAASVGLDGAMR